MNLEVLGENTSNTQKKSEEFMSTYPSSQQFECKQDAKQIITLRTKSLSHLFRRQSSSVSAPLPSTSSLDKQPKDTTFIDTKDQPRSSWTPFSKLYKLGRDRYQRIRCHSSPEAEQSLPQALPHKEMLYSILSRSEERKLDKSPKEKSRVLCAVCVNLFSPPPRWNFFEPKCDGCIGKDINETDICQRNEMRPNNDTN